MSRRIAMHLYRPLVLMGAVMFAMLLMACPHSERGDTTPRLKNSSPADGLTSPHAAVRRSALQAAATRAALVPEEVAALIAGFALPSNSESIARNYGLMTAECPETRIVVAHSDQSRPLLRAALNDPNLHVRRYAAYCMQKSAVQARSMTLRAALLSELERLDQLPGNSWIESPNENSIARGERDPRSEQTAAFESIYRAYERLSANDEVTWLRTVHGATPRQQAHINYVWSNLVPGRPRCEGKMTPFECGHKWQEWFAASH